MSRNDEGEFELVLGNRQLITVFLIVVILLGIFFSMGYIVGRNSGPAVSADAGRNSEAGKPILVEHPSVAAKEANSDSSKPSPAPAPIAAAAREEKPAAAVSGPIAGEPPPGDYWQVVATSLPDAEIIAEALAKKGFKAIVAPSPKAFFRVLVGPFKDSASMAETRTKLEAAGFKNPLVRKY